MKSSDDFNRLKQKWYKKLQDTGFNDIEQDEDSLKSWCTGRKDTHTGYEIRNRYNQIKEEYFRLAGFFLYDHTFKSKREEFIWRCHSEGMSLREISRLLVPEDHTYSKDKINRIVRKLENLMRVKYKVTIK